MIYSARQKDMPPPPAGINIWPNFPPCLKIDWRWLESYGGSYKAMWGSGYRKCA